MHDGMKKTGGMTMDDFISRRDAIGEFYKYPNIHWTTLDVLAVIDDLPSVPERKGHWTETEDGWDGTYYVCSECGCPWALIDGTPEDNGMKFCPNCGARME